MPGAPAFTKILSMQTTEEVPCICGEGALNVEVLDFGVWRIEKVEACSACGSKEIAEARLERALYSPVRHRRAQAARPRLRPAR